MPASNFEGNVQALAFPYWTDLDESPATLTTGDGTFYVLNSTYVAFEWTAHANYDKTLIAQYSLAYDANKPGVLIYRYYQVYLGGNDATIGIQGSRVGPAAQFGFKQAVLSPGLQVTCDTTVANGSCVSSSF